MHGIHHSTVRKETDSNWSTIFSFPDYLHRTVRLNVPQQAIAIGVLAHRDPAALTLRDVLILPFRRHRPSWESPAHAELTRKGLPIPPSDRAPFITPVTTLVP
jgi:hypothetical protein